MIEGKVCGFANGSSDAVRQVLSR